MNENQKNDQQGNDANVESKQNSLNTETKNKALDSSTIRLTTSDSKQIDLSRRKYKYNLN